VAYDPIEAGALCKKCPLWQTTTPVPPRGKEDAEVVIVGEGPGYQEVKFGKPFIGPSGILLDEILEENGFARSRCFITNAILCRAEIPDARGKDKFDFKSYMTWLGKENSRRKKSAKANGQQYVPLNSPIDCCAPRLWAELDYFERRAVERGQPNGAVVLALGNTALKAVAGREGIMKWRGSPIPIERKA